LNAVDGRADRVVKGGPGKDICRVDPADEFKARGCEIVKIVTHGAPGAPGAPGVPGVPGAPSVPGAPGVPGGPKVCAAPPEDAALARVAQDDDPPPTFSNAFYAITTTITASADGMTGDELPISIEDVCDVPRRLRKQAAQLAGADGIAMLLRRTTVWQDGAQLTGGEAATAIDGADTASLRVRLKRPSTWRQDEDGEPVPTFRTGRIEITD
jgi:hypothetical protein